MTDDFWKDATIIDAYTDEQAIEDGVIIPVKFASISRITRSVFDDFDKFRFDAPRFYKFMNTASSILEAKKKQKDDWFYSANIEGKEFFFVENGAGFTLMKPEDY
ncbi:MAG: hypothetical protein PHN49_01220 [Candidatus Omnitrophica bacterium]|nr:hypothetical protein [Candidatus Omnitrophota bacterium]